MEDRDGLGQRQGQVEKERALPGLPGGLDPQLALAVGGGVRLGGQQPGVQVGGFAAAVGGLAQPGAVGGFALAEQQVIRATLDRLAGLEAECLGAGAPPAAGRLAAAFAGLDVIAGRVFDRAAVDLLPDVVKVVALAQRRDNRHRLIPPQPKWVPMIIRWCMGVELGSWGAGELGSGDRGAGELGSWGAGELGSWGRLGSWGAGELGGSWARAGELGSWGAGELGSWGAGELGSWGAGELGSWAGTILGNRNDHRSRVTKRWIKIRNEKGANRT